MSIIGEAATAKVELPSQGNCYVQYIKNSDNTYSAIYAHPTVLKEYSFYGTSLLKTLIIHNITSVDAYACTKNSGLESIILPDTCTSFNQNSFCDNKALTSINIPYGVTTIPNYCLAGCNIQTLDCPETVKSITTGGIQAGVVNLILRRTESIVSCSDTNFHSKLKKVYVPESLLSTYQERWSMGYYKLATIESLEGN